MSPVEARFWAKVEKRVDGCWVWTAKITSHGYGEFWIDGRGRGAHRVAYELVIGPIPEGLEIDHLCRVRNCVNPAHLEAVTASENIKRTFVRGRRHHNRDATHCRLGHPLEGDNLYISPRGGRFCRICARRRDEARCPRSRGTR
jgi:hypothetical protein